MMQTDTRCRAVCLNRISMHENVPDEWIDRVFAVMALCPQHTFQILSKRAYRMRGYLSAQDSYSRIAISMVRVLADAPISRLHALVTSENHTWPLSNVWLGISAERQREADERIPHLLQTPAAIRFVSCEPLLDSVDLRQWLGSDGALDWVIVGGESGHRAKPIDWKDAISLKNQCEMAGVPFFYKQHGEWWHERQKLPALIPPETLARCRKVTWSDGSVSYRVGKKKAGRYLDGQEHNNMPGIRSRRTAATTT